MAVVRVTPNGIMDKDTDLAYVSQGNYVDANDVRHRQTDGNTFGGVMSVTGNQLALTIPSYTSSTKAYRIYVDTSKIADNSVSANEGSLFLESSAGTVYSRLSLNIATSNLADYVTALKVEYNTLFALAGFTPVYTLPVPYEATGTYTGYFDITTSSDTDFILKVNNITATFCTIKLRTEYYATGGDFKVIGSRQLESYLFVWLAGTVISSGITSEVSEIGVIYSTDKDVTFNYVRLLRSKKMGFSTERRVEAEVERNGDQINLYWTDGYNKPRAMYLKYSLVTTLDAFLFTAGGRYELETIGDESSFFYSNPKSYFDNVIVQETGGNLISGNKRYTGRFLTDDLVPTDFIYPTNPINIYASKTSVGSEIHGSADNTPTNKFVKLTIKNIVPGIYRYFELIALEYTDATFTSKIVQRFSLATDQTELEVQHTNLGQENILLSNSELLAITSKYISAQTIKVFDNRLTISNLNEQVDLDLSTWAQTITHSIEQGYVEGVGKSFELTTNLIKSYSDHKYAEYLDPMNTYNYTSYVYNDTYRFGIQVQWKNTGKWSSPYWVDDIRIDRSGTNVVGNRRTASIGGVDINLQDTSNNRVKYYYVKFHNVNLNTLVSGSPIRNLISSFRFVRSKRIPEVLATGVFFAGAPAYRTTTLYPFFGIRNQATHKGGAITSVNPTTDRISVYAHQLSNGDKINITANASILGGGPVPSPCFVINATAGDFQISTSSGGAAVDFTSTGTGYVDLFNITVEPLYRNTSVYNLAGEPQILTLNGNSIKSGGTQHTTDESNYLYFFSPDLYFNNSSYTSNVGADKIKLAAKPYEHEIYSGYAKAKQRSFDGSNVSSYQDYGGYFAATTQDYTEFTITHHSHLETGARVLLDSTYVNNRFEMSTDLNLEVSECEAFKINNTAHSNTALPDNGMWYGQLFRDLGGNKKYPINKELSSYESIGHYYILYEGQNGTINNISVYGGDSFIQKSHMALLRAPHNDDLWGGGYGVSFYSQNAGNLQMFNILEHDNSFSGPGYIFPQYLDKTNTGKYWVDYLGSPTVTSLPAGSIGSGLFYWLEQWPEVSNQNNYSRSYNYRDESILENGYNTNLTYNGYLPSRIAWSAKKVIGSQKDNYRIFKPIDFADLDLTLGPIVHHDIVDNNFYTWQPYSVQRQYFRDASLLGAQEGTDVVIGSGSILASRGQELTSIGMSKKWSFVKGKTPTGKETFYWYNDQLQKIVRFGQDGTRVISDKGMISYLTTNGKYVSGENYPLTGKGVHGVWNDKYAEAIFTFKYTEGVTNKQFTVVYDEIKNGFVGFHSYYPNIYLPYKNTFFSPNPALAKALYVHDRGSESTYYGSYTVPSITGVMNYDPNISKNFEALQFVTDTQPFDVYLTTTNHVSYLDETDFEKREDLWYSPIKNDSTSTGLNNGDTSRLWGKWLKIKTTLEASSGKQKLINFMVKFRPMTRLYNQ